MADTVEVCRWLVGFGAAVEVLAPLALRESIRRGAERLAVALAPTRKPPVRVPAAPGLAGRAHEPRARRRSR